MKVVRGASFVHALVLLGASVGCFGGDLANDDGWAVDGQVVAPPADAGEPDAGAGDAATKPADAAAKPDGQVASVCKSWTKPANGMCGGAHCLQTFEQLKESAEPDSVCGSDVDLDTLCSLRGPDAVGACALTHATDRAKIPACAAAALEGAVSAGCLDCYVKNVDCTFDRCLLDCLAGSATAQCDACRVNKGCAEDFFACARLAIPPTE